MQKEEAKLLMESVALPLAVEMVGFVILPTGTDKSVEPLPLVSNVRFLALVTPMTTEAVSPEPASLVMTESTIRAPAIAMS